MHSSCVSGADFDEESFRILTVDHLASTITSLICDQKINN